MIQQLRVFTLPDGRTLTSEQLLGFAHSVVELWESVEHRADEFEAQFGASPEVRAWLIKTMREAAGGEALYRLSKQLVTENEE